MLHVWFSWERKNIEAGRSLYAMLHILLRGENSCRGSESGSVKRRTYSLHWDFCNQQSIEAALIRSMKLVKPQRSWRLQRIYLLYSQKPLYHVHNYDALLWTIWGRVSDNKRICQFQLDGRCHFRAELFHQGISKPHNQNTVSGHQFSTTN